MRRMVVTMAAVALAVWAPGGASGGTGAVLERTLVARDSDSPTRLTITERVRVRAGGLPGVGRTARAVLELFECGDSWESCHTVVYEGGIDPPSLTVIGAPARFAFFRGTLTGPRRSCTIEVSWLFDSPRQEVHASAATAHAGAETTTEHGGTANGASSDCLFDLLRWDGPPNGSLRDRTTVASDPS